LFIRFFFGFLQLRMTGAGERIGEILDSGGGGNNAVSGNQKSRDQ
jgi:hypothetical protein